MTGIIANLVLNMLIVGLLAATISYCWVLNRRIKILQDSKSELAQLLTHFDESTQRASESIIALQSASKRIGENIQHRIEKANYLIDDLSFLIERGGKIASQLEAELAVNRARSRAISEVRREEREPEPMYSAPASYADDIDDEPVQAAKPTGQRERAVASLEAVLERVVGRSKPAAASAQELETPRARPGTSARRSKAEQELLELILAGVKG